MEKITIRNLTFDDLSNIERLFEEPSPGSHKKRLEKQDMGYYSYYGLFVDEKLVGVSLIRWTGPVSKQGRELSTHPEIGSTYILPEHRGKHLFTLISDHADKEALKRGYTGIGAVIRDTNTHSIAVHQKLGYKSVGTIEPHPSEPTTARHYYIKKFSSK